MDAPLENNTLRGVLDTWLSDVRVNEESHYNASKAYRRYHQWLGLPVVAFSALVASSSYFAIQTSAATWLRVVAVLIGAISVILAAAQSFSRFSETAEAHRRSGAQFSGIRRLIEVSLHSPDLHRA